MAATLYTSENRVYHKGMGDKDIWVDVFKAIQHIEGVKANLEEARLMRDKEIANIYKNGVPVAQIARRVGLSRPTIHRILAEQGVKD